MQDVMTRSRNDIKPVCNLCQFAWTYDQLSKQARAVCFITVNVRLCSVTVCPMLVFSRQFSFKYKINRHSSDTYASRSDNSNMYGITRGNVRNHTRQCTESHEAVYGITRSSVCNHTRQFRLLHICDAITEQT